MCIKVNCFKTQVFRSQDICKMWLLGYGSAQQVIGIYINVIDKSEPATFTVAF